MILNYAVSVVVALVGTWTFWEAQSHLVSRKEMLAQGSVGVFQLPKHELVRLLMWVQILFAESIGTSCPFTSLDRAHIPLFAVQLQKELNLMGAGG